MMTTAKKIRRIALLNAQALREQVAYADKNRLSVTVYLNTGTRLTEVRTTSKTGVRFIGWNETTGNEQPFNALHVKSSKYEL